MGLNDPDPTYTPSLLERYGQCEADIAMLQAMLKGFMQDEDSLGLNLDQTILRAICRTEEERERVRQEYEQDVVFIQNNKMVIEARAEALCNLWGYDPNDGSSWVSAMYHATQEWREKNANAYPAYFGGEEQ